METLNFMIEYWAQISVLLAAFGWSISKLLEPLFEINKIKRMHKRDLKVKIISDMWDFYSLCINGFNEITSSNFDDNITFKIMTNIHKNRNRIESDIYKAASICNTNTDNLNTIINKFKDSLITIHYPISESIKNKKTSPDIVTKINVAYDLLVKTSKVIYKKL